MNPNVGANIYCRPPFNPAKTGSPTSPAITYTVTAITPSLLPIVIPIESTTSDCRLMGTGPIGMEIADPITRRAIASPTLVIVRASSLLWLLT